MNCIICNSSKVSKSEHISRTGSRIELIRCASCGHIYQDENKYVDLYTTGLFTKKARKEKTPSKDKISKLDKKSLERINFYKEYIDDNFDNILEIGSSIGSFVFHLKLYGKDAYGLEPDPDYAAFSEHQYGFKQYNGLLEDFEFERKFDAVCSFHVLEHIKGPNVFFEKAKDILNPGGKLLFELPSLDIHFFGDKKHTFWEPHIHYFTASSLYYLASKYFKVIDIGYFGDSIYIFAEKSDESTFSTSKFKRYKRKAKTTSIIVDTLPTIKYKNINVKQLFLQPFFQKEVKKQFKKVLVYFPYFFKEKLYVLKEKRKYNKTGVTHITYYRGWENTGDTVLSKCVRDVFNSNAKLRWNLHKITNPVTPKLIAEINRSKFMVLGGGGVFLPDTNKNNISGWQWAISKEQIDSIKVPIVIYAVGYNYFIGQTPNDFFIDNLKHIVSRSSFFGMRNHGSINKAKELVGEELGKKIKFQPCPTTVIRRLYPKLPKKVRTKNIGVNIAFDRYERRFGDKVYSILDNVAGALKEIEKKGYNIYNICHLDSDARFELSLINKNVNFKTVLLNYKTPVEVYKFYNKMELVMGMRGHAQMIPFGLNCHILSLGTHDKMRWFLEDIDAAEWYIDLQDKPEDLASIILNKFETEYENKIEEAYGRLIEKQDYLFNITMENSGYIDRLFQK